VAPIASGSLFTKVARGFTELTRVGLVEPKEVRFVGAQAAGCAPVASAFTTGADEITPVRRPDTIVRSLSIGSPADGRYALDLARRTGGSVEAVTDEETALGIRRLGRFEGVFAETAGGVTIAATEQARRSGVIEPGDEVVALITGNGVKTPDARQFGLAEGPDGEPGLARPIEPTYRDFEALRAERGIV